MIVTRFPPSPTGFLHVGGLRTALYNYLFARQKGGRFILRIEDTDQKRYMEGAVINLLRTLRWAGITYDEGPVLEETIGKESIIEKGTHGPYVQSQRLEMYRKFAEKLLESGAAYKCFCSEERLKKMREEQMAKKLPPKYDRHCLALSKHEIDQLLSAKTPRVIRQRIPDEESVMFHDHIRDDIIFRTRDLDDQILMKSDGYPTYHLANVVDDHDMEVTHVIRGEEWLSSTPKHILLYRAFGWNVPEFGHLPLLLDKNRQKLSKRMGHVAVEDYIKEGYLPEAVLNFVALLGWNPGKTEQEIFALEELVQLFSLEKVHKGGAIFDLEKLDWMNWQWRRKKYFASLPPDAPLKHQPEPEHRTPAGQKPVPMSPFANPANLAVHEQFMNARKMKLQEMVDAFLPAEWKDDVKLGRALITVEEKILQDPKKIREYIHFYFTPTFKINKNLLCNPKMGVDEAIAKKALHEAMEALSQWDDFSSPEALQKPLLDAVEKLKFKKGQILWPVRVALTNEQFSPGVFETIWVLEKDETLRKFQETLKAF